MVHRCHGMRRSRFSRDSAAAAACSTVRFRPWGALTVSQVPQHAPLPPPTTLRPSAAMLAAQRATLHAAPRALALGPGRSRQRATPRHVGARRAACFPAAHTCTIALIFVRLGTALAAAGGGAKASWVVQWPAGLQEDVRHRCISYSARLAPWKGHRRCAFPRRTPPRHLRSSWPSPPLTRALDASSRRSKICSLSSI